jgi:hypothetical protein
MRKQTSMRELHVARVSHREDADSNSKRRHVENKSADTESGGTRR